MPWVSTINVAAAWLKPSLPSAVLNAARSAAMVEIQILNLISTELKKISDWTLENITLMLREFLSSHNLKMPNIGPLLRACIAGVTSTPDLASMLLILGKDKTLIRINKQI